MSKPILVCATITLLCAALACRFSAGFSPEAPTIAPAAPSRAVATAPSPDASATTDLIWHPPLNTTWQWQLTDLPLDQSFDVDMYDIELFEDYFASGGDYCPEDPVTRTGGGLPGEDVQPAVVIGRSTGDLLTLMRENGTIRLYVMGTSPCGHGKV